MQLNRFSIIHIPRQKQLLTRSINWSSRLIPLKVHTVRVRVRFETFMLWLLYVHTDVVVSSISYMLQLCNLVIFSEVIHENYFQRQLKLFVVYPCMCHAAYIN